MTADVLAFRARDLSTDGGKAHLLGRRSDNFKFRSFDTPLRDVYDDLAMDHADPCNMPSDSPYSAPECDPA
jgi:hypothetical protein